jgi:membrane protease YdiL (CAAX protease family)
LLAFLIAPVVEEFGFRGSLYPILKGFLGGRVALWVCSGFFAWVHFYWVGFLPLLLLGVFLTLIYERTRSVWAAVGFHATFNGINLLQLWIFKIGMNQVM